MQLKFGGLIVLENLRRGCSHPTQLEVGDTLDCWRVEDIKTGRHSRLVAEMTLHGRAWLDFEVEAENSGSRLRQTAMFDPVGLWGQADWYGIWPWHQFVFAGMLRGIAQSAKRRT